MSRSSNMPSSISSFLSSFIIAEVYKWFTRSSTYNDHTHEYLAFCISLRLRVRGCIINVVEGALTLSWCIITFVDSYLPLWGIVRLDSSAALFRDWIQFRLVSWFWCLCGCVFVTSAVGVPGVTPRAIELFRLGSVAIWLKVVHDDLNILLIICFVLIVLINWCGLDFSDGFSLWTWFLTENSLAGFFRSECRGGGFCIILNSWWTQSLCDRIYFLLLLLFHRVVDFILIGLLSWRQNRLLFMDIRWKSQMAALSAGRV